MRGGYLEEETNRGKQFEPDKYPYTFLNWWQIDVFNYFSHHFVTIPPEEYTRISHKHGVLSLGTFITEWIPGKAICKKILENEETVEKTANSLVAIARHFGFDGWLINIENEIEPERIELLIRFCSILTQKSRESNENSRVIWYDSVLHSGRLNWQNELNTENCKFYEACDAIYLNYNWTDHKLLKSAELAPLDRIYVGVDVWARGCVGEFQCHESFALASLFRMSVALFAPGWIYEKFPDENQIVKGIQWKLLGSTRKTAQELRAEVIDLPADLDQLQFICLKNREELIETRAAKEHTEQQLRDEITVFRAQLQEERAHREEQEVSFTAEISKLQSELGSVTNKMAEATETIADQDSNIRQIRDLQSTVAELEGQVQQVQNERAAVEQTAQNYKQRCASLQQELDTSEVVQRDFVKLSQSLQIQLEKIRQSEQEVRWQWDEDVNQCSNCDTSLAKLKAKPHCLHCGKIFCATCLKNTVPSGPSHRPANVCKVCHTLLNRDTKPFFATQDK
uniref:FYVE-type domain-containing protein n=2 Tax=Caenorhabditis japonica TaxID=281687 RepID=A0A8R1E6W3_CAEJA